MVDEQALQHIEQRLADEIRALAAAVAAREMTEAHRAFLEQRLAVTEGLRLTVTQQERALRDMRDRFDRYEEATDRLTRQLDTCQQTTNRLTRQLHQAQGSARDARREAERAQRELMQFQDSTTFALARVLAKLVGPARTLVQWVLDRVASVRARLGGAPPVEPSTPEQAFDVDEGQIEGTTPSDATKPAHDGPTETPPQRRQLLVDGRGLQGDQLEAALEGLEPVPADSLVVVIDSLDFAAVQRWGVRFEYMPAPAMVADRYGEDAARGVREERWQQILDAHEPTEIHRAVAREDGTIEMQAAPTAD